MYKLYDYYEGEDLIGEFNDWFSCQEFMKEYRKEVDGECDLEVVSIEEE